MSAVPERPPYRPPLWMVNTPIALWWAGLVGLGIMGSPFAIAWFSSGLLMLLNCVLAQEAEDADAQDASAGNAPSAMSSNRRLNDE